MQGELPGTQDIEPDPHSHHGHVHCPGERKRRVFHVRDVDSGDHGTVLERRTVTFPADHLGSECPEPTSRRRPFTCKAPLVSFFCGTMRHLLVPREAVGERVVFLRGIHACNNASKPFPETLSRTVLFLAGIFRKPGVVTQSIPGSHIESKLWITISVVI